ncbi:MAG: sulfite exporter TauE/SafE family protein [Gemmataceae bacterium]|nr:sulfite exporter TauE/SafE family protein [Gemmataceae bacterium]
MTADALAWLPLACVAFAANTVADVTGFGRAVGPLPFVVTVYGVRDAVPVLTVSQLLGNLGRVWANRREVSLPVVGWYSLGAVPAALLGGTLFAATPPAVPTRALGPLLLVVLPSGTTAKRAFSKLSHRGITPLGLVGGTTGTSTDRGVAPSSPASAGWPIAA